MDVTLRAMATYRRAAPPLREYITHGFLIHDFGAGRKSWIFEVPAAPATRKPLPTGGPHRLEGVSGPPGRRDLKHRRFPTGPQHHALNPKCKQQGPPRSPGDPGIPIRKPRGRPLEGPRSLDFHSGESYSNQSRRWGDHPGGPPRLRPKLSSVVLLSLFPQQY